jgi:hypothetical protein
VIEVIFSMLRRSQRNHRLDQPDRLHLHTLIHSRYIRQRCAGKSPVFKNSLVVLYVAPFVVVGQVLALLLSDNKGFLMFSFAGYFLFYLLWYRRLALFSWRRALSWPTFS